MMPFPLHTIAWTFMLLLISSSGYSEAPPDTVWNQTDEMGWKQGHWRKYYSNGELMYRGFFRDNQPEGKMQRFYEDGKIKAELIFSENAETTRATMYFRNGQAGAVGKYTRQLRDSIWNYYSYYTGTLSCRESYRMGVKDGPTLKYYPEGPVAEELHWKDDLKHGKWEQFYEDSILRLSSWYNQDQIHGPYRVYNRNQVLVIDGIYKNGKMDGDWRFYDNEGNLQHLLQYDDGNILNEEELDKWAKEFMDDVEKNLGKIPEPDIENFFERSP